jgi:hypothetical protein
MKQGRPHVMVARARGVVAAGRIMASGGQPALEHRELILGAKEGGRSLSLVLYGSV